MGFYFETGFHATPEVTQSCTLCIVDSVLKFSL